MSEPAIGLSAGFPDPKEPADGRSYASIFIVFHVTE